MTRSNEIGIFVAWVLIGIIQIINCISGAPVSWLSYFVLLGIFYFTQLQIIHMLKNKDSLD